VTPLPSSIDTDAQPAGSRGAVSGEPVEILRPTSGSPARVRLLWYPRRLASVTWADDLVAECDTFVDAIAMPVAETTAGKNALAGAIYSAAGGLVGHSERGKTNRVWKGNLPVLADRAPAGIARLEGRTFFAGHHRHSFGHVLLEILPRFWPELDYSSYDTLLFYPQRAGRSASSLKLRSYARDLLSAATGSPLPPLQIVAATPLRVAELTVSSPAFWLKRGFGPALTTVFQRVGDNLMRDAPAANGGRPRRVYLSRSHLTGDERRAENEADIEALVSTAGFTVVHPQELSVQEQVALVRSADAIVGCDGSALHLAAFARAGTRVVALDSRWVPNQLYVDHLAGLDAVHVMAAAEKVAHQRTELWHADLSRVERGLDVSGLLS